jgi:hypothetical protein
VFVLLYFGCFFFVFVCCVFLVVLFFGVVLVFWSFGLF